MTVSPLAASSQAASSQTPSSLAAPPGVGAAIARAAESTGADFSYLVATAYRESGFDPSAQARTSSAAGLFQFIEQTWLGMVKRHGAQHGMGAMAAQIEGADGRYSVADPQARQKILDMRYDSGAAAAMAGAYTAESADFLSARLGRQPSSAELYAAHFLGPAGAARLIEAAQSQPDLRADTLFPAAARANRSIFRQDGAPASVAQVLDKLSAHHRGEGPVAMGAGRGAGEATPDSYIRFAGGAAPVLRGDSAGFAAPRGGARVLSPLVIEALAALETPGRPARRKV